MHVAPKTTSTITSKSISKNGGRALDEDSRTDTYPYIRIDENNVDIGHEATVSKIGEEQLFYLMSRGLSEAEAAAMIVSGFVEPITKELPLEYAIEMNRTHFTMKSLLEELAAAGCMDERAEYAHLVVARASRVR
jgi:Fe-S cluster assembly protein SufB